MGVVGQLALKPTKKELGVVSKGDKEKERDRDKTTEKNGGIMDLNLKGVHVR